MRRTGRTEIDLAILSYDEKRATSVRAERVRHPRLASGRARGRRDAVAKRGRSLTARKAIDVWA